MKAGSVKAGSVKAGSVKAGSVKARLKHPARARLELHVPGLSVLGPNDPQRQRWRDRCEAAAEHGVGTATFNLPLRRPRQLRLSRVTPAAWPLNWRWSTASSELGEWWIEALDEWQDQSYGASRKLRVEPGQQSLMLALAGEIAPGEEAPTQQGIAWRPGELHLPWSLETVRWELGSHVDTACELAWELQHPDFCPEWTVKQNRSAVSTADRNELARLIGNVENILHTHLHVQLNTSRTRELPQAMTPLDRRMLQTLPMLISAKWRRCPGSRSRKPGRRLEHPSFQARVKVNNWPSESGKSVDATVIARRSARTKDRRLVPGRWIIILGISPHAACTPQWHLMDTQWIP